MNTDEKKSLEERIGDTMAAVGPSITLTSITDVVAFLAGSFNPLPALRGKEIILSNL